MVTRMIAGDMIKVRCRHGVRQLVSLYMAGLAMTVVTKPLPPPMPTRVAHNGRECYLTVGSETTGPAATLRSVLIQTHPQTSAKTQRHIDKCN